MKESQKVLAHISHPPTSRYVSVPVVSASNLAPVLIDDVEAELVVKSVKDSTRLLKL